MCNKLFRRVIIGLAVVVPAAAFAAPITYQATFTPLNESGVSGSATLAVRPDVNELTVTIDAFGLVANQLHPQHIHGRSNDAGAPIDSVNPTPAEDTDNDGFTEVLEAASSYGPIMVPLTSPPDGTVSDFPTASTTGELHFQETYNLLSNATYADGFDIDDLAPRNLDLREIVLHGGFGIPGPAVEEPGLPGEVGTQTDNTGEPTYIAALPVASAEIETVAAVPEPAAIWLLLFGFGFMALGLAWRSQQAFPE